MEVVIQVPPKEKKGPGSIFRKVGAGETVKVEQQTTVFKV